VLALPAQSLSPLTLLRWMASWHSFAFRLGSLTVRQRQRRDHAQYAVEPQQRVIADGLKVAVVGTLFLLAVKWNLGLVYIQHYPLWKLTFSEALKEN
jgi:hypothetical protein